MSDGDGDDLVDRDFGQYWGYWHGFTFLIFDGDNPEAWIRSSVWVGMDELEDRDGDD